MWLNTLKGERAGHWLNLVIFTSLDFREFVILGLFSMSRIRELSISMKISTIIIIFARFLYSRICPPREIRKNQNVTNITRSTILE